MRSVIKRILESSKKWAFELSLLVFADSPPALLELWMTFRLAIARSQNSGAFFENPSSFHGSTVLSGVDCWGLESHMDFHRSSAVRIGDRAIGIHRIFDPIWNTIEWKANDTHNEKSVSHFVSSYYLPDTIVNNDRMFIWVNKCRVSEVNVGWVRFWTASLNRGINVDWDPYWGDRSKRAKQSSEVRAWNAASEWGRSISISSITIRGGELLNITNAVSTRKIYVNVLTFVSAFRCRWSLSRTWSLIQLYKTLANRRTLQNIYPTNALRAKGPLIELPRIIPSLSNTTKTYWDLKGAGAGGLRRPDLWIVVGEFFSYCCHNLPNFVIYIQNGLLARFAATSHQSHLLGSHPGTKCSGIQQLLVYPRTPALAF